MAAYVPTYPAPYQQKYVPRPPPAGWVPPPFAGPPPIPTGITVNPQQWQKGFWMPNPSWNGARPTAQQKPQQQHTLWIPSQHWQQHQQQQPPQAGRPQQQPQQQAANFNPYKRVIQPPSAEYLATKLSDNPLGLTNMKPATIEEYYKQGQPVVEQHTPWIWNPANLEDEDEGPPAPRRKQPEPEPEPESFTSQQELKPTFSPSIIRTPEHYRDSPSPTARRGSRASIDSLLSARMANLATDNKAPPPLSRHATMPAFPSSASPSKPDFSASSAPMFLSAQISDEPDSILSPLVISTPKPLPQSTLRNTVRNHHPNPILSTQSLDTIPEATFYNQNGHASVNATPKGRGREIPSNNQHASTLPNPPTSPIAKLVYQQPQARPSPLPRAHTDWEALRKDQERETERRERIERERERIEREQFRLDRIEQRDRIGSRHTIATYVDPHVNTTTTSSPKGYTPGSSRHSPKSRPSSRSSSAHPSPTKHSPPAQITPPGGLTSPSSSSTRTTNPLPPPPQPSTRIPSSSSNSSRYYPPPQLPEPDSGSYHYKVRHGFWNRRGDHLTPNGFLVYAPPHLAYPDDLQVYPLASEGYTDHDGQYAAWCPRPELPASLPRLGKDPELPYEKFVVFDYK